MIKTIAIPPEVHRRVREMAARRGMFLTDLAGEVMIVGLEELKRKEKEERASPRRRAKETQNAD